MVNTRTKSLKKLPNESPIFVELLAEISPFGRNDKNGQIRFSLKLWQSSKRKVLEFGIFRIGISFFAQKKRTLMGSFLMTSI